jgi:hypothetical protein
MLIIFSSVFTKVSSYFNWINRNLLDEKQQPLPTTLPTRLTTTINKGGKDISFY